MFFQAQTKQSPTLNKMLNNEVFFKNYVYNHGGLGPVLQKLAPKDAEKLVDHILNQESLFQIYLATPAHISAVFKDLSFDIQTKMLNTVLQSPELSTKILTNELDYQNLKRNFPHHRQLIKEAVDQQLTECTPT
jgi:hypothetical protein